MKKIHTHSRKDRKKLRVRSKIASSSMRPRLHVFRSVKHIYAQIIDDVKNVTLAQASDKQIKSNGTKSERATAVGQLLGERAKKAKVTQVVFDRGIYSYHGRIKALADAVRGQGISF